LREAGFQTGIISAGSSPTARHAENLAGITEMRAGVYMFGDLFQSEIETHGADGVAVTVLASVIGRRPGRVLVDAGGLALSKDRSTETTLHDFGYGLALDMEGQRSYGHAIVAKAYQEHGVIEVDPLRPIGLPIGGKLRIAPNHACMTAAAHDRYFVVDGDQQVAAIWHRVNGW
jgi:D-serine deaminase-like pyridoxal phosphate-dependent protein